MLPPPLPVPPSSGAHRVGLGSCCPHFTGKELRPGGGLLQGTLASIPAPCWALGWSGLGSALTGSTVYPVSLSFLSCVGESRASHLAGGGEGEAQGKPGTRFQVWQKHSANLPWSPHRRYYQPYLRPGRESLFSQGPKSSPFPVVLLGAVEFEEGLLPGRFPRAGWVLPGLCSRVQPRRLPAHHSGSG